MNRMGIWEMVVDFFTRLLRGRIDGATIRAKSKVSAVEYKAKAAVSKKFNEAVDGAVNKGKDAAQNVGKKKEEGEEGGDDSTADDADGRAS